MNTEGSCNSGMSSRAKTALIRMGAAGPTAPTVFDVKKMDQGQAEQTQDSSGLQQRGCPCEVTPPPEQIAAELFIHGEELASGDADILFARWCDRNIKPKRMLVLDANELGCDERDFLIGEGTFEEQDQLYVWELRGKDWMKIATVATRDGKSKLSDLDLEGTPFAVEIEGKLYRSGEVTMPGNATLTIVDV